jgi:hypothetical protein
MADTPLVVVFPRGQLTTDDKTQMRDAGIIAVEADDPKQVQQLHLTAPLVNTAIKGDAIVRAALKAIASRSPNQAHPYQDRITSVGHAAHDFVRLLSAALEANDGQQ